MALLPMLIAPFQTGLNTDVEPWLAPADSFSIADNVHIKRGIIEKRSGYRRFAQLQKLDTAVPISTITNEVNGVVTTKIPHGYSTNNKIYISSVIGMTQINDVLFTITVLDSLSFKLNSNTEGSGTYERSGISAKVIDSTDRVMGISRFLSASGTQVSLAFNTTQANQYNAISESYLPLDPSPIMSGSDTDYIWTANWQSSNIVNRLYFTNGKAWNGVNLDGIRYYDASGTGNTTIGFRPFLGEEKTLYGAKLLFVVKQRLVVLNTYESNGSIVSNYPQRARWCQVQGPSNWNDITAGGGGFVDAPTGEQIISARSLQDQIIVFFTNSVWTLRAVPDPALPFRWDKISDFRACDGKMASIGYDRYVIAAGIRGITATNGVETKRIDHRIESFNPNKINIDAFNKVFCERSYVNFRLWTLYPPIENTENKSALIYDDESTAFTTYSIDMNCLGYGNLTKDYTIADFITDNKLDFSLEETGEETLLDYYLQGSQETLLGGNTSGTVYIMEMGASDDGNSISSTLYSAAWNPYKQEGCKALMSYIDIYVDTDQRTTALIRFFKDNETDPYASQQMDFLPNLFFKATVQGISLSNPCRINVAQHGFSTGDTIYIYGANGMPQINNIPFVVNVIDKDHFSLNGIDSTDYSTYTSGANVYLKQFYKTKTWKRVYAGGIGYEHKIGFTAEGSDKPFRIHALKPYFKARGKRTIN